MRVYDINGRMVASLLDRQVEPGEHSVGAIWRRQRLSCPPREQLGSYLLGVLDDDVQNYIQFHLQTIGCAFCLANLARQSGQRALDVEDSIRVKVVEKLRSLKIPAQWPNMVEHFVQMEAGDRGQLFGESLPIGLRLIG